jgi:hypothetical protein
VDYAGVEEKLVPCTFIGPHKRKINQWLTQFDEGTGAGWPVARLDRFYNDVDRELVETYSKGRRNFYWWHTSVQKEYTRLLEYDLDSIIKLYLSNGVMPCTREEFYKALEHRR